MRADSYLTEHGFAPSRERAKKMIAAGGVTVDGKLIKKPSEEILDGEHLVVVADAEKYVGRGGYKLEGALSAFAIDVEGRSALDIGASTGGFTDCLLQHGADSVIAVDAGEGQLAAKLREDPRVKNIEHMNARNLSLADIGGRAVELIVMDVSFISATYIIPRFSSLLTEQGEALYAVNETPKKYTWACGNLNMLAITPAQGSCAITATATGSTTVSVSVETDQGNTYTMTFDVTVTG